MKTKLRLKRGRERGEWDRPPDDLRKGKFEANLYHLLAVFTSTARLDWGTQLYKCKRITIYSLIDN